MVHGALTKGARDTAKGQKVQVYIQCEQHIAHTNNTLECRKPTPDWSQRSITLINYSTIYIKHDLNTYQLYKVKIFTAHTYITIFDKSYIEQ